MHLPGIHWPLEANIIRKNALANTFGMVHHLHFEIRTVEHPGHGLEREIDPLDIYGVVPVKTSYYDSRPAMAQRIGSRASGVKVSGIPYAISSPFAKAEIAF